MKPNPFAHQDEGGPLGVFLDGRLVAAIPEDVEPYEFRDRLADKAGRDNPDYEVLKSCAKHPNMSAVDCLDCWPL